MSITQGADTYIELADADTYIANLSDYATAWDALEDSEKEEYLKTATRYLDSKYMGRFVGELYSDTQALSFPRIGDDIEGRDITGVYPVNLQYAQAEIAARLSNDVDFFEDLARGGDIKREKVGPLETEYFNGSSSSTVFQVIDALMKRYLLPAGNIVLR